MGRIIFLTLYLVVYLVGFSSSGYAAVPRRNSVDDVESVALVPEAIECFFCEQPVDRRLPYVSLARREDQLYYHPQCLIFPEGTIELSCCGRELSIDELNIDKVYEDGYIDVYVRCPFCKLEIIHKGSPKSCRTLCKHAPRDCMRGMAHGLGISMVLGIIYLATFFGGTGSGTGGG